ncbi:MAG: thiamine pyrophosphate-dependent dehydrogenase E1 component subunit alpha [Anaerolineae bacterium]
MTVETQTRHAALGLRDEDALRIYRAMVLARALDERMWLLNRQGTGFFAVPGAGHEAAAAGYVLHLRPGQDWLVPHYRDLAGLLLYGMTAREMMCSYLARANDPTSGGRQNYAHWGHKELRIKSISSPQGPTMPQAVGLALAQKIRGEDNITFCGFGDGSSSKADFHEALNFAGIHKCPVVFYCENNGVAISVPQHLQMAVKHVADRAAGHGFPGVVVDGNDVLAVCAATKEAVERARAGAGPTLVEATCHRLMPHTSNDDDRYRPPEVLEEARRADPIPRFQTYLESVGLLDEELEAQIRAKVADEVEDATEFAMNSPEPAPEDALKFVYAADPRSR